MGKVTALRRPTAAATAVLLGFFATTVVLADDLAEMERAFQADDARLNREYQTLRNVLDEVGQSSLKSVQRSWIAFKEKDFAIFSSLARIARDTERIYRYKSEETIGRMNSLGALSRVETGAQASADRVKTAREADQILNNIYRECIQIVPPDKVKALKEAQSLWIEFRDLHCRFDAAIKRGRFDDYVLRDLTMTRVIQLRHYMRVLLAMQLPTPDENREKDTDLGNGQGGTPPADLFRFAR